MLITKEWIKERENPLRQEYYYAIDQYFLEWFESQEETDPDKILEKLEDGDLKVWFLTQMMTVGQNLEWSIEAARLVCPIFEEKYHSVYKVYVGGKGNGLCSLVIRDTLSLSQLRDTYPLDPSVSFDASLAHYLLRDTALDLVDFVNKEYHPRLLRGRNAGLSANRAACIAVHAPNNTINHFRTGYLAYEAITFAHGALVESRSSKEEWDKAFKLLLDIGLRIYEKRNTN